MRSLICLCLATLSIHAAEPEPIRVATKIAPPFVMQGEDGALTGISVDLATHIAAMIGRPIAWQMSDDVPALLQQVATGKADVGIAAISATAERETFLDFSHPLYTTGLGVAASTARRNPWLSVIGNVLSPAFLSALAGLTAVLALAGLAVWLFERKHNTDFGGKPSQGLGSAFWWSAVTMTTVGYGDKAPKTLGGRIVALGWMFASIIIISSFTAAIATSLTVDSMETRFESLDDLPLARAAVIDGTTGATDSRVVVRSRVVCTDLNEALDMLADGAVDVVIHDRPLLRHGIKTRGDAKVHVLPGVIGRQDYAIALPENSPVRESLNLTILEAIGDGLIAKLTRQYLD